MTERITLPLINPVQGHQAIEAAVEARKGVAYGWA